jgi:hypothetical protein
MYELTKSAMNLQLSPWELLRIVGAFVAFVLLACAISPSCGCAAVSACSPADTQGEAALVRCRERITKECKGLSDAQCPVIAECSRWAEQRCEASP